MKKAKITAIANLKGGVGKTTTATTMAHLLARSGQKTLLIDFDPQANSTYVSGIVPQTAQATIASLMAKQLMDEPLPADYVTTLKNGVDFIPSGDDLTWLAQTLTNVDFRENQLGGFVENLVHEYDHILVDALNQSGILLTNVLMCADEIIIPIIPEVLSTQGFGKLIGRIRKLKAGNPRLAIGGILFTLVKKNTSLASHMIGYVKSDFGADVRIFNTIIPHSVKVSEAQLSHKTISEYAPANPVAIAYHDFLAEWLGGAGKGEGGRA